MLLATRILWVLRSLTGYRLYHLVGALFAVALALAAMALPFVWLGEAADGVAGIAGIVLVALAYCYVAMLTLAFAAIVMGRLAFGRLRRSLSSHRVI